MEKQKLISALILIGGIIELGLGILHFTWPFNLLELPDFVNIVAPIKDLIILASISVGLCMVVFAFLSFYFSRRVQLAEKNLLIFCYTQCILWIVRVIFELTVPVTVPMFIFNKPSSLILVGLISLVIIYSISIILFKKIKG